MGDGSGEIKGCALVNGKWSDHQEKVSEIYERVNLMENALAVLTTNSEHLKLLPDIKTNLLEAATSKKHVDVETFQMVIKYFGSALLASVTILGLLLTGAAFGVIKLHQ